jgi:hypothetical protein
MLKEERGMYLQYACAIAKAPGFKLVIDRGDRDADVENREGEKRIDTDLRKALKSEQEDSKSLRERIEWLRLEYERLRREKKSY